MQKAKSMTQGQGHFWHQMRNKLFGEHLHFQWLDDDDKNELIKKRSISEKVIARKNSNQNGKFLVGKIDGVVMASIMAGHDGHWGSINYLAVDLDHLGAS